MVSTSPRLRDSLDFEDPEETDPRLAWGFSSLSLQGSDYHEYDDLRDERPVSASSDTSSLRRNRRRQQEDALRSLRPFDYQTCADGETFRLVTIKAGYGNAPIECDLTIHSAKAPGMRYKCLSYCWLSTERDAFINLNGFRFALTTNLHNAMHSIRRPTKHLVVWIDQICINQDDLVERAQQVSIMKHIFNNARQSIVWLGQEADHSSNLCEYAKRLRPFEGMRTSLSRILTPRQLEQAIAKLVDRPWFKRVWVIPEVCLAQSIRIVIGKSTMTWENLVMLIRDIPPPQSTGFARHAVLPGNTRQRIAILAHMIAQQKEGKPQIDVSQLLILSKSSNATDIRDKIYAFYGMTIVNTSPDYTRNVEALYTDVAHNYINNIEACYADWNNLTDQQRNFQLMSILYSAGALHQTHRLPSWVPDWNEPWRLAPIWCRTVPTAVELEGRESIRSEFRAGGDVRDHFEVIQSNPQPRLRLSVVMVDELALVSEAESTSELTNTWQDNDALPMSAAMQYMRAMYKTKTGLVGVATQGVKTGDMLAIALGGDVPVVIRESSVRAGGRKCFELQCETLVSSHGIMYGDFLRAEWPLAQDILLV